LKVDVGCGPNKKDGFIGVDRVAFAGVDHVCAVGSERLPFEDGEVDEVHASHFVEHLTSKERFQFVNELYRVMKPGAKALIITPHWASNRAYGDLTHQWPPVAEMWFCYLNKAWRDANAPHTDAAYMPEGYACDFDYTVGYGLHGSLATRNTEYQQHAVANFKEAIQDMHATIIRRE